MNNKELTELKKIDEIKEEFIKEFVNNHNPYGWRWLRGIYIEDIWDFFLPHLKSNDEIKREAVEESMLLRLSSRVHAMFRDAIDPKSVSGYNEALDDVQDMIQEYLTQQSLDGGDKGKQ